MGGAGGLSVRLDCACGRTYKTADHDCPECGQTLVPRPNELSKRPVPPESTKIPVEILIKQKLALRDELRARDRQIRLAENRIKSLQAQLERMLNRGQDVHITASPLKVIDAKIEPVELPDDRIPVLEGD